jgi:hypothetical protein
MPPLSLSGITHPAPPKPFGVGLMRPAMIRLTSPESLPQKPTPPNH